MGRLSFLQAKQIYPERIIFGDYLASAGKLAQFYRHYPANEQALSSRVGELASSAANREGLCQALAEYNRGISAGSATLENVRLLAEPQTLAVVTGQQPGFAGGPLYNIYKAVSAIKLARHLSETTGKNVVPIFWIASEDANPREVSRAAWINRQGQFWRTRASLPDTGRQICTLRTDQAVLSSFNELMDLLPASKFRNHWQELYKPNENKPWGQWFGGIYAQLFAEYGLVLLEPHIVYPFAGEIFDTLIPRLTDLQQTFDKSTASLIGQGYAPQLSAKSRVTIYTVQDGRRQPISSPNDNYDLQELSCSVMFRPIVQDFLLPTVAYVAGPAEISYFAQLTELYNCLEVTMPVIWPRASMTLVEPHIGRLLEKSALSEQEFFCESALRLSDSDKGHERVTQSQLQQIGLSLRPRGQPQERVFPLLAYLVYYGGSVLDQIFDQVDVFDFRHRIVYLDFSESGRKAGQQTSEP